MTEPEWNGILVVLVVFLAAGTCSVGASPVFNPDNGHFYELVNDPWITWIEARDAAAGTVLEGTLQGYGHLATITSPEENAFVFGRYPGNALGNTWIGGFQNAGYSATANEGWQWVTGEPWAWAGWNGGEPSNHYYGAYGYENATAYWYDTGL